MKKRMIVIALSLLLIIGGLLGVTPVQSVNATETTPTSEKISLICKDSQGNSKVISQDAGNTMIFLWYTQIAVFGAGDNTSGSNPLYSERLVPEGKVAIAYDVSGTTVDLTERGVVGGNNSQYIKDGCITITPQVIVDSTIVNYKNLKATNAEEAFPELEYPRDNTALVITYDAESNRLNVTTYYNGKHIGLESAPSVQDEVPIGIKVGSTEYKLGDSIPLSGATMDITFIYESDNNSTNTTGGSSSVISPEMIAAITGQTGNTTSSSAPVAAENATPDMSDNSSIDSAKVKTSGNGTAKISNIKSEAEEVEIGETAEVNGVSYKVKTLGEGALKKCKNATEVTLPSTLTKIERGAFTGAKSLKSIRLNIKKSITIQKGAFKGLNTENMTIKVSKKMSDKEFSKLQKTLQKSGYEGKITRSIR